MKKENDDAASYSMPVRDLHLDDRNANRGTARGRQAISDSLKKYKAGRSVLLDKNNCIIAGNKTLQQAENAGIRQVRIVESDGSEIVAVKRVDLDLKKDGAAKGLAIADNRSAELDLDWDADVLAEIVGDVDVDLGSLFTEDEIDELMGQKESLREMSVTLKPKNFVRVLISIPVEIAVQAQEMLDGLAAIPEIEIDYSGN